MIRRNFLAFAMVMVLPVCLSSAVPIRGLPEGTPEATIDLMTGEGLQQVKGEWRYSDVKVMPSEMRGNTEGV